ncbi:MAG: polysaccharide lyase [Elusimicrobiota bacterium]
MTKKRKSQNRVGLKISFSIFFCSLFLTSSCSRAKELLDPHYNRSQDESNEAPAVETPPIEQPSTPSDPLAPSTPPTTAPAPANPPPSTPASPPPATPPTPPSFNLDLSFNPGWQARWNVRDFWGEKNTQILSESGKNFIRVKFPKNSYEPAAADVGIAPLGGCGFHAKISPSSDQLTLSYAIRFANNFQFIKGGKLPGLYGGTVHSGGMIPNGTNGWSTRYMWRSMGNGAVYAYLPTSIDYGTYLGEGRWRFTPGVWMNIKQKITLNTPGSSNGKIEVWVNNTLVHTQQNVKFRTVSSLKVDGIFFELFFGGDDPSWATPVDTHIDMTDFKIS